MFNHPNFKESLKEKKLNSLLRSNKMEPRDCWRLSEEEISRLINLTPLILADKIRARDCAGPLSLADESILKLKRLMPLILEDKINVETCVGMWGLADEIVYKLQRLTRLILADKIKVEDCMGSHAISEEIVCKLEKLTPLIISNTITAQEAQQLTSKQVEELIVRYVENNPSKIDEHIGKLDFFENDSKRYEQPNHFQKMI